MTPQQAGGETAWVRAIDGGQTALAAAPLPDGRVAVSAGAPEGAAVRLVALDSTGLVSWSRPFSAPCPVSLQPLGAIAPAAMVALASAPCSPVVSGLGADTVPANGALVLLDASGAPAGRLAIAADLSTAGIAEAVVTSTGEVAVRARTDPPIVALAGADGVERWRRSVPGAEHVAAAASGEVVVGSTGAVGVVTRVGRDGTPDWSRVLPAGFGLQGIAVLTDGAVAAVGTLAGAITWGRGAAGGSDGSNVAVVVVEPDGAPRTASGVARLAAGAASPRLVSLPHGRLLLYGPGACDRLRALSPQLEPVWDRALDPSCAATAATITVSGAGQIVVGGSVNGAAEFGSGYALDGPAGTGAPFALALWP